MVESCCLLAPTGKASYLSAQFLASYYFSSSSAGTGAIYIFASKAVIIGVNASFTNNSATGDGGIDNKRQNAACIHLRTSTPQLVA